jgi:DEAD/DEAH box helicase domain-containing protein
VFSEYVPGNFLSLFRSYFSLRFGFPEESLYPFGHQARVFDLVAKGQETFLVAGTASGKTLAIAVPLFTKLQSGLIQRVLFIYPTVALMEDQLSVMDTLAQITGLEVSYIRGGMSRSKLISALTKPIILSTPDEIYWFFRKNVKYNGLLIYGLCQVDEFVLDEAHLFNGLMLRNFEHFWQRIKSLTEILGKTPRLHILTATPTEELQRLTSTSTELVIGKSKCDEVEVEFRACGRFERAEQFANAINEVLGAGQRKVLVVCNSARLAHQLFEKYKVEDTSIIPAEHRVKFGKVALSCLASWLEKSGMEKELIAELNARLFKEEDVVLADVPKDISLKLPLQDVVACITGILEKQCWRIRHALREKSQRQNEPWETLLHNRSLPCRIIAILREQLESTNGVEQQNIIVEQWITEIIEKISNIPDDTIHCQADEYATLVNAFMSGGIDRELSSLLVRQLAFEMKADPAQIPTRGLSHRPVYLRWLDWMVEKDKADKLRSLIRSGLESGELDVECRHIGLWKDMGIPLIVYSGSMAKQAREGLINVFADLEQAVLVSTSAVEVGVDFNADTLITEECEGNSFLQRFGRVGRQGKGGKVIVLVSGDTYVALNDLDNCKISREDFSTRITKIFPHRNYATGSQLLDASHYLVNEQLGRIGERLNRMPGLANAKPYAEQLRAANIQFSYGLRSTMPQISLRDGVTKDPFYLLRYVGNENLTSTDSPFEVARAKMWLTSLIFQPAKFEVIVDLEETLKVSRHIFIWAENKFHVWSQLAAGSEYLRKMFDYFGQKGDWTRWHQGNFLLLYGDVYLKRIHREVPNPEPVCDSEQNPLFIPNQTYLVLWGWTNTEDIRQLFEDAGVANWEELYYDWVGHEWSGKAMVILEKTTGACFSAYKELLAYVNRKV